MNYTWHSRINFVLLCTITGILARQGRFPEFEIGLFWIHGMFHTIYASPDIDHKKSKPTKNMGVIGWVTSRTFKHRHLLHNPSFWTVLYGILGVWVFKEYHYQMWWVCGGLIAIYSHILVDTVSTTIKRAIPF